MTPPAHAEDHDHEERRHGDDRIFRLLELINASQDRSSAQILASLGAVQIDLRTLAQADQKATVAQAETNLRLTAAEKALEKSESTAKGLQDQVDGLKEQVTLWRGVTIAMGALLSLVGVAAAVAKLLVHP